jgi:hypothetical protein
MNSFIFHYIDILLKRLYFYLARVQDLIQNAFGEPLTAPKEMVRFTFIIGGGKLVRSRYHEDLGKWMVTGMNY